MSDEQLLAGIMRRVLTTDKMWVSLAADDLNIDGWVRLTADEETLVRGITGKPD